ncbi:MAG: hypothetical protein WA731_06195 [Pseudonocardiaceae bacterium]
MAHRDCPFPGGHARSIASTAVPDSGIGAILISSRSLPEYRAMFSLTERDLRRRILDCPGGAASLTAELNAVGGDVTACDPVYADTTAERLATLTQGETARANRYIRAHPEQYRWSAFASPDDHYQSRSAAGARFAADRCAHPERYVPGALPHLPFGDGVFDLVLSSHLLFAFADRLDYAFHYAGILELIRVTGTELRIFPLVAMAATVPYPRLEQLRTELANAKVITRVVDVDYEFQTGGNQMLVCTR